LGASWLSGTARQLPAQGRILNGRKRFDPGPPAAFLPPADPESFTRKIYLSGQSFAYS